MDKIVNIIRDDLAYNFDSTIYELDGSQTDLFKVIKDLLKEDYGFLDIIIDSKDYKEILLKLENYNEQYKNVFLLDYLLNRILTNAGVKLEEDETVWFDSMLTSLKERCKELGKSRPRVHFFLDDVDDVMLQTKINDLFSSRGLTTIGYKSKNLLTYYVSNGQPLEATHDYRSIQSDKLQETLEKQYQRKKDKLDNCSH